MSDYGGPRDESNQSEGATVAQNWCFVLTVQGALPRPTRRRSGNPKQRRLARGAGAFAQTCLLLSAEMENLSHENPVGMHGTSIAIVCLSANILVNSSGGGGERITNPCC